MSGAQCLESTFGSSKKCEMQVGCSQLGSTIQILELKPASSGILDCEFKVGSPRLAGSSKLGGQSQEFKVGSSKLPMQIGNSTLGAQCCEFKV